jgi:RNA polymerase sigma-70 factor (ECF subfamily)
MSDEVDFVQFIERIRSGDQRAAAELVARYEPVVRREIRLQLDDQNLVRAFDSMDICQSVLASFFVRTAAGEYQFDSAAQLLGLLLNMTRNKLVSAARREFRQRRDLRRRSAAASGALESVPDKRPTPSDEVDRRELLERIYHHLTPEELQISRLRCSGAAWDEIAAKLGGSAQSRRMQFSRALERVADTLGVEM